MLTGLSIPERATLVYPFKHIVVYESQIRKFVELLSLSDTTTVTYETLKAFLNRILRDALAATTNLKSSSVYADPNVSKILASKDLAGHFRKKTDASRRFSKEG